MKRSLFTYFETIAQIVPEALVMFRAASESGFIEVTERLLIQAVAHLEQQAKNFRESKEDTITAAAIGFFNRYGIRASSQTNSRGHVDIFVSHAWKPGFVICGEAKIWKGVRYHIQGLVQVLGYTTGRLPYCFVLSYVKTGVVQAHVDELHQALDKELPEAQTGPCSCRPGFTWMLFSEHKHSSGVPVQAQHVAVKLVC